MHITDDELPYWLALLYAPGVGPIKYLALLTQVDKLSDLFLDLTYTKTPDFPQVLGNYLRNPPWSRIDEDIRVLQQLDVKILNIRESSYPQQLKEIVSAPPLLFILGQADLVCSNQIAMVGSRNPTPNGKTCAERFASELCHTGLVITSGLALGIDAASHAGCLLEDGQTIAIMGTGIDLIYPTRHQILAEKICEKGALVTEFPPGTPPKPENFPRRNRIISGLSLGVLVVEAALRSGSLTTARYAIEQGREVFAIPGSVHNPLAKGCHQLLRHGAKLVESIDDIQEELSPRLQVKKPPIITEKINKYPAVGLAKEHAMLVECLSFDIMPIDNIIACTGLTAEKVAVLLVELELVGLIDAVPGGFIKKT